MRLLPQISSFLILFKLFMLHFLTLIQTHPCPCIKETKLQERGWKDKMSGNEKNTGFSFNQTDIKKAGQPLESQHTFTEEMTLRLYLRWSRAWQILSAHIIYWIWEPIHMELSGKYDVKLWCVHLQQQARRTTNPTLYTVCRASRTNTDPYS